LNYEEILSDAGQAGIYQLPADDAALEAAAADSDFASWRVDLAGVRGKQELLDAIARDLAFPEWFGSNWDALEDCLTDLAWCVASGYLLILENAAGFAAANPEEFETALEVLDAAAEYWYDEDVPFWVFVGGVDYAQFDIPALVEE
jgi:RNAse (barnase) inhibitor barstar